MQKRKWKDSKVKNPQEIIAEEGNREYKPREEVVG
jgi:hypothetical protein